MWLRLTESSCVQNGDDGVVEEDDHTNTLSSFRMMPWRLVLGIRAPLEILVAASHLQYEEEDRAPL